MMKKAAVLLSSGFTSVICVGFTANLLVTNSHFTRIQAASDNLPKQPSEVNVEEYLRKNKPETFKFLTESLKRAVLDSQKAEPINHLWALSTCNKNQKVRCREVNGKTEFLMSTWTRIDSDKEAEWKNRIKQKYSFDNLVWVTPAPQVKEFCQTCKSSGLVAPGNVLLNLRLQQYLGLKLEKTVKTHFIEMWVKKEDLIRPCFDEEIDDSTCNIPPVTIPSNHSDFSSFRDGAKKFGFPFTGLGYTYDWGNPNKPPIGASEFVIRKGTPSKKVEVEIESVTTTTEYCNNKSLTTNNSLPQ